MKPHDTGTSEGRSKERYRRAALTTLASLVSKGVVVLTTFISVPLTLGYLGMERYGMWMTMSSLIAVLGFLDLGMGNSLKNHIADANGRDDKETAVKAISSAYLVLSIVAVVLGIIFFILYPFVPWMRIFNVSSPLAIAESGSAVAVFIVCFLLNIPLGLIIQIQSGYQEGFVSNLWQSAGSILGLLGVLTVIYLKAGLPWLVVAMAGAPCFFNILNTLVFFNQKKQTIFPKLSSVDLITVKNVMYTGSLFLFAQIISAVAQSSDNIIVAQTIGSGAVASYSVCIRLFSVISMVQNAVISPYWPAYREALSRGDIEWTSSTLKKTIYISILLSAFASLILVVFGRILIHYWASSELNPSYTFLIGLAAYTVITSITGAIAIYLNSSNILSPQIYIGFVYVIMSIIVKVMLGRIYSSEGIMWGGTIVYFLVILLPFSFICVKNIRNNKHKFKAEVMHA